MSKRALVVDDTMLNRKLAIAMLKREGWEANEAESGEEALAKLGGEHGYQVVLLDIKMPGMSGEDVCRTLRADPRTATLPLIAYTAHALEDEQENFLTIGFDAVLIKPIEVDSLGAALKKALAAHS